MAWKIYTDVVAWYNLISCAPEESDKSQFLNSENPF